MELHKFNTKYSIYWDRLCQKNYDEGCWKMNCEDYSDYFLQKYLDDSFKSEILKVLFEKDPLTEDEKKKILNSMYLESFLLSTTAHVNSLFFSNLCLSLAACADVNSRILDNSSEPSPLHVLSMDKSKKVMLMMDILLTHPNIQVNVKDRSEFQKTPLMIACLYGSAEAFSKLCRHPNIDFNCRDTDGYTALHYAFYKSLDMHNMHLDGKKKILMKIFKPDSNNFDVAVETNDGENVLELVLRDNWDRYNWFYLDWMWKLLSKHPVICCIILNVRNKEGVLLESPEIDLDVRDSAGKNLETIAR